MVVTVGHAHQQLVQKAFQYWYIKTRVAHIEIFLQILIQKLKDQSEFPFGVNYIVQSHNIRVLEAAPDSREIKLPDFPNPGGSIHH